MPPIDWLHVAALVVGAIATWIYQRQGAQLPPSQPGTPATPSPGNPGQLTIGHGQLLSLLLSAFMAKPPSNLVALPAQPASDLASLIDAFVKQQQQAASVPPVVGPQLHAPA